MADFGNTGFGVGAGGALPPNVEKAVQQLVDQRMRALLANDVSSLIIPRSLPESAITPAGAAGSMLVDDGRTTKWVAPGANGSVLTRDDTQPGLVAWRVPYCARMYFGNQSIPENAWTKLTTGVTKHFETTSGMVDTTNSQIVIPVAGLYRVTECCRWVAPGVNVQLAASRAYVAATATELTNTGAPALPGAATTLRPSGTATWPIAAGSRIELDAYWYAGVGGSFQTAGGAMAVYLEVHYLGPIPP